MQKLQIVFGISAILAALVTLYLWPVIRMVSQAKVYWLLIAALVYVVIWFVLCYAVAIGMYLIGMW